jgi:hypothetical protein
MHKPRFILKPSTDGVGKTYPQHQEMLKPYDYGGPRSIHKLVACMLGEGFPDFEPDFNTVVLDRRAIPTDLISSAPIPKCGHLISSRFLELLQNFKLPPHRIYDVPLLYKEEPLDRYIFLLLPHPESLREATSTQDIEEGADADPLLQGVSLLRLSRPSWMAQTWVDARLKAAIEATGITGVKIS